MFQDSSYMFQDTSPYVHHFNPALVLSYFGSTVIGKKYQNKFLEMIDESYQVFYRWYLQLCRPGRLYKPSCGCGCGTCCRHAGAVLSSDSSDNPTYYGMKANDTSTAESGSELEELTSPKTNMNSHVAKLTPVSENANGKKSPTVLSEYEDCVPMVVKVVDVAWESQEMSNASEGYKPLTVDVFER
ncbi:hypothetical protein DY000_02023968 [Brassica cretica]|uniref:Uncharacterized protein n=1 Tax=Brassica cretica TaxID=69181 RepID=A0ABQ7EFB3_BRACR|nr:hypothetical protein DY000_02023968 [Brassica cretica]